MFRDQLNWSHDLGDTYDECFVKICIVVATQNINILIIWYISLTKYTQQFKKLEKELANTKVYLKIKKVEKELVITKVYVPVLETEQKTTKQ